MKKQNTDRQWWLWALTGIWAPLAHYSGAGVLAMGVACGFAVPLAFVAASGWKELNKQVAFLELVGTILVLTSLLAGSGVYWPADDGDMTVPLVILAMASVSVWKEREVRAGSTTFWIVALLLICVGLAGAARIRMDWVRTTKVEWSPLLIVTFFLLSLTGLQNGRTVDLKLAGAAAAVGLLCAVLVQGSLSLGVSSGLDDAFYQTGRTLGHLELVIAVAATLGWYVLATFLVRACCCFGTSCGIKEKKTILGTIIASGFLLIKKVQINQGFILVLTMFLWIIVPIINEIKKMKNIEKST